MSYSFRLYPTKTQESLFDETIETCRLLYNKLLSERKTFPKSIFSQKREMTAIRKSDKYLHRVHSQVLQDVAFRLDKAFVAWRKGMTKAPRFKRRGRYNSFTYPQFKHTPLRGSRVRLGLIGAVRIRIHREIAGRIKRITVFKDVNQWFAILTVQKAASPHPQAEREIVGVDLGISNILALSDGTLFRSPSYLKSSIGRVRSLQRDMSRKLQDSKGRDKARLCFRIAWRRLRRQRMDFVHKASHFLATRYRTLVFEDLPIGNMVKNHAIASAIMGSMWGQIRQSTAYKAERRSGRVLLVPPQLTSQKCSGCGRIVRKRASCRIHRCPTCMLVLDRDVNAARNILKRGLEEAPVEAEPLPVIRIGKFGQGSKKLANGAREHFTPSRNRLPGPR